MINERYLHNLCLEARADNNEKKFYNNDSKILPYIANGIIFLIPICFTWAEQEEHNLRIEITFLTAFLIVIGNEYEVGHFYEILG